MPVIAFNPESDGTELKRITGSVIVIDEGYALMRQRNTASILRESDNYFIIISRKPIDYLPLCVENLYEMCTSGREHWITPKYTVSDRRLFLGVEFLLTEDSGSGLEFFKQHYEIPTGSAHSKSEIVNCLEKMESSFSNILVVYDSAAFAYQKGILDHWVSHHSLTVQELDWYSFEHYILTQKPFNIFITQDDISYRWESLEQASEEMLKKCIEYDKSKLSKCLYVKSMCSGCRRVSDCDYRHTEFIPDLQIVNDNVPRRMEI